MLQQEKTKFGILKSILTAAGILTLGGCTGCTDVAYDYNIPDTDAQCPAGMDFRSGGAGIVDRSGGSGIVDRNGSAVQNYCYAPTCPNPDFTQPAEMEWHLDSHQVVVADPHCPAPIVTPPPCSCDDEAEEGDTDSEGGDEEQTEDGPSA